MQFLRYLHNGVERCGVADGGAIREIREVEWGLRDLFVLAATRRLDVLAGAETAVRSPHEVTLLPPLIPTSRVYCIGVNYLEHQIESRDVFIAAPPAAPVVFLKDLSAMAAPGAELQLPETVSGEFDWEVELAVVIGAPARAVAPEAAGAVIAGYTVANDVTARDLQVRHVQWTLGKNIPASTPIGPGVVPWDEVGTTPDLRITLDVNGIRKQDARTSELLFGIPALIAEVSAATTLHPGDVIVTGTPSGVGFKRNPPEFLRDGDVVEACVEGIGTLTNRIRTRSPLTIPAEEAIA